MIEEEASRRGLRHGIHPDRCKAFMIAATEMHSSKNILFADTAHPDLKIPAPHGGSVIRTKIYPKHILASGSIPLVLPPIEIDGRYYFDGGLRQYTPLSPLIHMGANKIIILGTRSEEEEDPPIDPPNPNLSTVGSYALNAMSLDFVERDLEMTERMNEIIDWGVQNYGTEFADKLKKDLHIRNLKPLHLRPSINLGKLAQHVFDPKKIQADANTRWLLSWLHETKENFYGDYSLSFLLFDPIYTKAAEQLGFDDTKKREEEIIRFFTQPSWMST
jgi:NTE family protein